MKITIEFESLKELLDFKGINTTIKDIEKSQITISDLLPDYISGATRARNCLYAIGIETVDQLLMYSKPDLLRSPNLGLKSLHLIIDELSARGMKLKYDAPQN